MLEKSNRINFSNPCAGLDRLSATQNGYSVITLIRPTNASASLGSAKIFAEPVSKKRPLA